MGEAKIRHFRLGDVLSVASKGKACYWPNYERGRKEIFHYMLNNDVLFGDRILLDTEERQHHIKKCHDVLIRDYPVLESSNFADAIVDFTNEINKIDKMYRNCMIGYFKRQVLRSKASKEWQKKLTDGYYGFYLDRNIAIRQL